MKIDKIVKIFNQKAEGYDNEEIEKFRRLFVENIIEEINLNAEDIVIDIGTGTGALAIPLAKKVKKVIAIDISKKMLEIARMKAEKEGICNIEFKHDNFLNSHINECSVDLIVSNLALHHLSNKNKEKAIKIMRKILKKDGKVIIGDIMFFFNPNKEPKKLAFIKKIIERLFPNSAYSLISALNNEHPSQTKDLKLLFEKNGFCTKVKMFLPILGIIYAVHKRF